MEFIRKINLAWKLIPYQIKKSSDVGQRIRELSHENLLKLDCCRKIYAFIEKQ